MKRLFSSKKMDKKDLEMKDLDKKIKERILF